MKALKFLKHMKQTDTPYNFRECEINEAIEELEEAMNLTRREWYQKGFNEAMKSKTCQECVAYDKDGNCKEDVRISNVQGVPSSFYCKWHEPKDNA